jgi:hypothetical protein
LIPVPLVNTAVKFRGITNGSSGSGLTNMTLFRSYNVASVIRTNTGFYTVNFSNAFSDTNYIAMVTAISSNSTVSATIRNQAVSNLVIATANSTNDILNVTLTIIP